MKNVDIIKTVARNYMT